MKFKKCCIWVCISIICVVICIGAVIASKDLYNKLTEIEISNLSVNNELELKNYELNIKIYHVYIISAFATFSTGIIAIIIAFVSPKIEKRNNSCTFKINMTDVFPYFNATKIEFVDFDDIGKLLGTSTVSETFIYRIGVIPKGNKSKNTIIAVKHFRKQGETEDVFGFLPMRLQWSYKDNVINQNERVIEKIIHQDVEQYCDFCFVKKYANNADRCFFSLCGEFSGRTGQSICNCIFETGFYEIEITVVSENSKSPENYLITFGFNNACSTKDYHPTMFRLKNIKKL